MKRTLLFLSALLMTISGAWATDVTVGPSYGTYYAQAGNAISGDNWGPTWKSNVTAVDGSTPLLTLTSQTGMHSLNGDIYSNQTYTLTAPAGYVIVGYTFNGTATAADITITPAGGSGTTVTNGSSLATPLSVDVKAQTTTFDLASSSSAHFENLALTVTVEHYYVVNYGTSTGSYNSQSGNYVYSWTSTATDPQVTFSVSGNFNNIKRSDGSIWSGANGCTYNLTAQSGYYITGYEIKGTAQTSAQTLTPAAGGAAVSFGTDKEYTLSVTGLSTTSTSFNQSTPNQGIAISSFKIFLQKYLNVTYNLEVGGEVVDEVVQTVPYNSAVAMPFDYSPLCYDISTSSTIGEADCTITVTATPKTGLVTELSGLSNSKAYTLTTERGALYIKSDHLASNYNDNAGATAGNFAIISFDGNYYLYSTDASSFVQRDGSLSESMTANVVAVDLTAQSTKNLFLMKLGTNGVNVTNTNDDYELVINTYVTPDPGNKYAIIEAADFDASVALGELNDYFNGPTAFANAIAQLEAYPYGTGLNQYSLTVENVSYSAKEAATAISGLKSAGYTEKNLAVAQELIAGTSLNLPSTGGFYKIKGYATNKYVKAGTPGSNIPNSVNEATDGTDIWYYNTDNTLINYSNGLGTIGTHTVASATQTRETATFAESTCTADGAQKYGVYEIKSNYSGSKIWYSNTNNVDRNGSNNHVNCEWTLEEVTSLPVTISMYGMRTFSAPVALTIPNGVHAYTVSISDNDVTLEEVETTIPANTPVILYDHDVEWDGDAVAGSSHTYDFAIDKENTENPLKCELSSIFATKATEVPNDLTLQYDLTDKVFGFWQASGGTIKGFSAYLKWKDSYNNVRRFVITTPSTGIESVQETPMLDKNIYDVQGRRVGKASKGLYIINGKKVIL